MGRPEPVTAVLPHSIPARTSSVSSKKAKINFGTKTVKKEMDKTDNNYGRVTLHVGHMKPLMMNPNHTNAAAKIHQRLIKNQSGRVPHFR